MAEDDPIDEEVRSLLAAGRKIEAVKLYRERTGAGLAEAKEAVEAIERGAATEPAGSEDRPWEEEAVELLQGGRKIEAIRVCRQRTGVDLKTARDRVESLAAARGLELPRSGCLGVVLFFLVAMASLAALAADASVSDAERDRDGFLVHRVESPYQSAPTEIRVLLPEPCHDSIRYSVVYVLPVEAQGEARYGDGLQEVRQRGLHRRYPALFVAPGFSQLPWYADHPSDEQIRQESHLLNIVIPAIETRYPAERSRQGRLLLGFSKSGWGAWSLLLRHPDVFQRAAAWDAPLMMERPGRYGSGPIFATQKNFDCYRLTVLLEQSAASLGKEKRLALLGYGNFRADHQQMHELLARLGIAHEYRDGPERPHDWHSGWVDDAVAFLLSGRSDQLD